MRIRKLESGKRGKVLLLLLLFVRENLIAFCLRHIDVSYPRKKGGGIFNQNEPLLATVSRLLWTIVLVSCLMWP